MRSVLSGVLGAALLAAAGGLVAGDYERPLVRVLTNDGVVLAAERNGRTLYVRVGGGGRPCDGACALDWPPFLIHPNDFPSDGLGIVHRADGRRQWSLDGRPLHFFAGDADRGEASGDGLGRWRALRPYVADGGAPDGGAAARPGSAYF